MNKKQKNMQIMNDKVEFNKGLSKFPKLTPRGALEREESKEEEQLSIVNKVDTPVQEQKHVKLGVPIENKRYSRVKKFTSYTVDVALPSAQGPQTLDGMRFIRAPFKTQESMDSNSSYQVMQTNTSVERCEDEPKLTEAEKKLKRYLNRVKFTKRDEAVVVKPIGVIGKPLEVISHQRLQCETSGAGRESRTQNGSATNEFDKYRMVSKSVKKELRMGSVEKTPGTSASGRKRYEGMNSKKLDELYSYIVPNRERFVGFMSQEKQKNNIYSFSKCTPSSMSRDFSNIKVDVDTNTKRITYAVGSVRSGGQHHHGSSKSQSDNHQYLTPSSNAAVVNNNNTMLNVKTASMSKLLKSPRGQIQSQASQGMKNSGRRTLSTNRPETEPETLGQFLDTELRPPVNIMPKLRK